MCILGQDNDCRMIDHKTLCYRPSDVMAGHEQALDTQKVKEFRNDAGLHFDRAVKAVPLIGITITNELYVSNRSNSMFSVISTNFHSFAA